MHPTTKPSPPGLSHIPLHTPQPRGRAQLWVSGQVRGALPGRPQILLQANSRSWEAGWLFLLCATIFLCPLRFPPPPGASAGGWAQLPRAQLPRPPPLAPAVLWQGAARLFPGRETLRAHRGCPLPAPGPAPAPDGPEQPPPGVPGPRRRGEPGRGAAALRGFCAGAARPGPRRGEGEEAAAGEPHLRIPYVPGY